MQVRSIFVGGVNPFQPMPKLSEHGYTKRVVKLLTQDKPKEPSEPRSGTRAKGYAQTADAIKAYVTANPGARSKELIDELGFSLSRIKLVLSKMCEDKLLTKVRDPKLLTTTFLYYSTGEDVPQQPKTKRVAVLEFITANPGATREEIYKHFGKRNCAAELCGLVKRDLVRGELVSSGTHYYSIEVKKW